MAILGRFCDFFATCCQRSHYNQMNVRRYVLGWLHHNRFIDSREFHITLHCCTSNHKSVILQLLCTFISYTSITSSSSQYYHFHSTCSMIKTHLVRVNLPANLRKDLNLLHNPCYCSIIWATRTMIEDVGDKEQVSCYSIWNESLRWGDWSRWGSSDYWDWISMIKCKKEHPETQLKSYRLKLWLLASIWHRFQSFNLAKTRW